MGYPMPRNAPEQYWMPGMQSYENAPWWKWNSSTGEWRCAACDKNFQNDLHLDNKEHGRRWYNWCVVYKNLPDMEIHHRWVRKNPDFKWDPTPPSDEEAFKGKGKKGKGKDGGRGQEDPGPPGLLADEVTEVQEYRMDDDVTSIAASGGAEHGAATRFGQWARRADQAPVSDGALLEQFIEMNHEMEAMTVSFKELYGKLANIQDAIAEGNQARSQEHVEFMQALKEFMKVPEQLSAIQESIERGNNDKMKETLELMQQVREFMHVATARLSAPAGPGREVARSASHAGLPSASSFQ